MEKIHNQLHQPRNRRSHTHKEGGVRATLTVQHQCDTRQGWCSAGAAAHGAFPIARPPEGDGLGQGEAAGI